MWDVACGMWDVACGMWHVACGMWDVACGMWDVGCGMWEGAAYLCEVDLLELAEVHRAPTEGVEVFHVLCSEAEAPAVFEGCHRRLPAHLHTHEMTGDDGR